ncbi:fungal-specific transcription factor domain-containing protein [Penicillium chrysogenum]|jgi:hypothetical protein|uniref:Fungal-specific transcription factor domain-containing protein n=1 Tax=Penicillium chrysogenum TaxID=5076 RepID=A0ABQ8WS24_PENCH|nr:fungal-specific transcription factor domain-containing protein [Penicillium chrysogenum]KAJ6157204.1 fungal-specific transcription factor domain-containing protein [Penicillium chrysogenum]
MLLQSALLMGFYPNKLSSTRDPGYWIAEAAFVAFKLGLHRDPCQLSADPRRRSFWKRFWWCVYVRERMLSLDIGSSWIINDAECDVPNLSAANFESDTAASSYNLNSTKHRELALIFIENTKLAMIFGKFSPISISYWENSEEGGQRPNACVRGSIPSLFELGRIDEFLRQ